MINYEENDSDDKGDDGSNGSKHDKAQKGNLLFKVVNGILLRHLI